jgi:hypothetical protein
VSTGVVFPAGASLLAASVDGTATGGAPMTPASIEIGPSDRDLLQAAIRSGATKKQAARAIERWAGRPLRALHSAWHMVCGAGGVDSIGDKDHTSPPAGRAPGDVLAWLHFCTMADDMEAGIGSLFFGIETFTRLVRQFTISSEVWARQIRPRATPYRRNQEATP